MAIAVIDYRAGNLTSVKLAFDAVGADSVITSDPEIILSSERVVFPGVGAAGSAMRNLNDLNLLPVIRRVIDAGVPFLGICVGTQVLFEQSEEDGGTRTLGFMKGSVDRFRFSDPLVKVPHMGWNQVVFQREHPLLFGLESGVDFYFVHSYYPNPADPADCIGTTDYAGCVFASMAGRKNMVATQFHVEKSGKAGLRMLRNFTEWDGQC